MSIFNSCLPVFYAFCLIASTAVSQTSVYTYHFRNNLDEQSGTGPALNQLGTGAFVSQASNELSCLDRPMYGFTQNSGIQFDNNAAGGFMGESYAIEMYFRFTANSGFKRIIDFKNQTSDFGLYCTDGLLQFYDAITFFTTSFAVNEFTHLLITRDSVTAQLDVYVDGQIMGSFLDTTQLGLPDASNLFNFFRDDLVFTGEAGPGEIALLRLHNGYLADTTVELLYLNMETTSGTVAFVPDITEACLNVNVFNFTNTSSNSGNVNYTWDFGDANTSTGTNASHSYLIAGLYNVTLIADNGSGCTDSALALVELFPTPQVNLAAQVSICPGDSVLLDPGPGFASYSWNTGSSDPAIYASASGLYTVVITDSLGCQNTDSIQVDVDSVLVDLGADTVACFGTTLTLDAPAAMQSYQWSTGETTPSIDVTASGFYAVSVTTTSGCFVTDTVEITFNPELQISLGSDTTLCSGNSVILSPGSGFAAYSWSDGSTDTSLVVSTTGNWSVTVTDSFGCTATDTIEATFNAPLVSLGNDTTLCGGSPLTLDAGSGFLGYLWTTGSQNQSIQVSSSGYYAVTVTDFTGCQATDSITVSFDPFVTLGPDLVLCTGLTATLDPGSGYSSYLWNDGSTSQTLNVIATGTYTVTVTDGNGCVNFDEVSVSFNPLPVFDLGPDLDICDGETTVLDAGQGFFAYLWSDGSTGTTLQVSSAGTYSVTVSSAPNCSATDSVTVTVLPAPAVDLGADTVACDGATVTLDAGPGFFSYLWNDGSAAPTLDVTAAGIYSVTIMDGNGCENTDSITVAFEAYPQVELGPPVDICSGSSATLDAGAGPYTYLWSDGSSAQQLTVTTAGTYSVTVTSQAGCASTDDVTVTILTSPVIDLGADTILCDGLVLTLDPGAGFTFYNWSDGSIAQTIDVTAPGTYAVTVTAANGCVTSDSITVGYHPPVPTPVITQNGNTLESSASSGNQWYAVPTGPVPGETGQTFNPGQSGTYYVIVTDANGCPSDTSLFYPFLFDGLQDSEFLSLAIMPNPASSLVNIRIDGIPARDWKWQVLDQSGRILSESVSIIKPDATVDVSELPAGLYFVRILRNDVSLMRKLVIQR